MRKFILGVCLTLSVCMFQADTIIPAYAATEESQEAEENFEYYEGKVTSDVNVRKAAGAKKEQVTVNGKKVVLQKGTIVTIIGSENVGDKPWYQIKFTYGKKEVTGYATSTYIEKTGVVITPTPLPEPTATPTAAPSPTPVPTQIPKDEITKTPEEQTTDSSSSSKTVIFVLLGVAIVGACAAVYFIYKKRQDESSSNEVTEKVAKLKDMVIGSDEEQKREKKQKRESQSKKAPEVRVSKGDKIISRSDLIQNKNNVYVKSPAEEEMAVALDMDGETMQKESEEKKALRVAINQLREHDIIIHKFFGKGEVFDNSDVKLIEVRFDQDVRFLNKDQLVNKKLVVITNEHRR